MPPAVGRMHASHMSNPFAHLNPTQSIPQSQYQQQQQQQQQQSQSIPQPLTRPSAYAASNLNGAISPFAQSTASMPLQNPYTGQSIPSGGHGLASEAAYRGFAHGAALQQAQQNQQEAAQQGLKSGVAGRIREVWAHNFEAEMVLLRELIAKYPYVSMVSTFTNLPSRPRRYTNPDARRMPSSQA